MAQKKTNFNEEYYEDVDLAEAESEEQKNAEILKNEEDYLAGLLEAADFLEEDVQEITISRHGKVMFRFKIHPLSDELTHDIRKTYTKYERNKRTGVKMSVGIDTTKFRSSLIFNATVEEDQEKLWNNPAIHKALKAKGKHIINALDVIDAVLLPGEKDQVLEVIDKLSGYSKEEELIENAKNL